MPRTIPLPGTYPSIKRDALKVFQVLKSGGVVIIPTDVGYGIVSSSAEGITRAFSAKKRNPGHTLGILGTYQQHVELHDLPRDRFEMSRVICEEHGALLAIVAPYKKGSERLKALSGETLGRVTKGETLGIAILEGPFQRELGRLNDLDGQLMIGSSANLTGTGQKFRVEDIESEVLEAADLVVDYGLQRYWRDGRAGTNFDLENLKVLRMGSGYEVFRHRMWKWFGVELPEDVEYNGEEVGVGVSIKIGE